MCHSQLMCSRGRCVRPADLSSRLASKLQRLVISLITPTSLWRQGRLDHENAPAANPLPVRFSAESGHRHRSTETKVPQIPSA